MVSRVLEQRCLGDGDADADAGGRREAEGDHVRDEGDEPRVVGGQLEADAEGDDELVAGDGWKAIDVITTRMFSIMAPSNGSATMQ